MKCLYLLLFSLMITVSVFAKYSTPGTGVRWNLDNLVANSNGAVSYVSEAYQVNDTVFISQYDTLFITTDATVKFAVATYFDVNGTILINPPGNVTFTALNTTAGYLGMRIDSSNSSMLRKLTFEYAISLRLGDCSPLIDSCIFRYNNNSVSTSSFGSGAVTLFRSNPLITNCRFLDNQRAAISGGANIDNAPKVIGCLFQGNNTVNDNVPQINLGNGGTDTVKIINNQFLRASTRSGGIGFLPFGGTVYAVITGNVIKNNRYGMTFNGGSNINVLVSYNQVDSNNTENNPNLGGSGISFTGGSATSPQNAIVTGNLFRWNLWGITIQGRSKPNLGNITNADTTDDGKNQFIGNTNATTPNIDLYNTTIDTIYAQNNYWGSDDVTVVESHIFHKTDNAALGPVIYLPLQSPLPIELFLFSATRENKNVGLNWQTASESNSAYFSIERGEDGRNFTTAGRVTAAGTSGSKRSYHFTDIDAMQTGKTVFYRLKLVDKDQHYQYSQVLSVNWDNAEKLSPVKLYPTLITAGQALYAEITSERSGSLSIRFLTTDGKLLSQIVRTVLAGNNVLTINPGIVLPAGRIYVQIRGDGFERTVPIQKQ